MGGSIFAPLGGGENKKTGGGGIKKHPAAN